MWWSNKWCGNCTRSRVFNSLIPNLLKLQWVGIDVNVQFHRVSYFSNRLTHYWRNLIMHCAWVYILTNVSYHFILASPIASRRGFANIWLNKTQNVLPNNISLSISKPSNSSWRLLDETSFFKLKWRNMESGVDREEQSWLECLELPSEMHSILTTIKTIAMFLSL